MIVDKVAKSIPAGDELILESFIGPLVVFCSSEELHKIAIESSRQLAEAKCRSTIKLCFD